MAHTLDLHSGRLQGGSLDAAGVRFPQLNFTRITAQAGAFAINGAALLLLLAPLSAPLAPPATETDPVIYEQVKPKDPPPPPRVERIEEARPLPTRPTPVSQPQPIQRPQPVLADAREGDIAVEPVTTDNTIVEPPAMSLLEGAHLQMAFAPPPTYPREALRDGLTGNVMLRVLVDVDGKPLDVQIETSSGHRVLDIAAKRHVLAKWRFKPAMQNGQAVQAIGLVPINFILNL